MTRPKRALRPPVIITGSTRTDTTLRGWTSSSTWLSENAPGSSVDDTLTAIVRFDAGYSGGSTTLMSTFSVWPGNSDKRSGVTVTHDGSSPNTWTWNASITDEVFVTDSEIIPLSPGATSTLSVEVVLRIDIAQPVTIVTSVVVSSPAATRTSTTWVA